MASRSEDTYAEARLRLPKASGSSGLSSHESDYGKGKRKKKATRKLSSADEEIPSPPASMIKRAKYITQPQRPTKEPLRDLPPPTHTEDDWAYDIAWETPPLPQRAVSQFDHCPNGPDPTSRGTTTPGSHSEDDWAYDIAWETPPLPQRAVSQFDHCPNGPDPTSRGTTTPGSHSALGLASVGLLDFALGSRADSISLLRNNGSLTCSPGPTPCYVHWPSLVHTTAPAVCANETSISAWVPVPQLLPHRHFSQDNIYCLPSATRAFSGLGGKSTMVFQFRLQNANETRGLAIDSAISSD
ncbi:hypothetical protein HPB49_006738 [Dermacentor silvarum]|uniref:Uncharacterized protein n=1 Tax=Dermacentor silvarum TaxID=543639 RepID=A0ACB8DWR0_DERSI|nr:hypothetical protein HPB49_006738 [Dermacentor silvarum]